MFVYHFTLIHNILSLTNCDFTFLGKTLGAMAQLERHRARMHSDARNHVCDTCGMTFKTRANLQAHANLMHNPNANLSCDQCGKYFKYVIHYNKRVLNYQRHKLNV